jgi:hypothetical protein
MHSKTETFALNFYLIEYPQDKSFDDVLDLIRSGSTLIERQGCARAFTADFLANQIEMLAIWAEIGAKHEPKPEPYALCVQWTDRDPTVVAGAGPEDAYAKLVEAIKDDGAIAQLLDVSCRVMPESLEELQSLIECYNEDIANCKIVGVYASGAPVAESVAG